jgi:hypothetical protein
MRLLICTRPDLTSVIMLNALLARLGNHDVRILVSAAEPPRVPAPEAEEINFFERDLPFKLLFPLIDHAGSASGRWRTMEGLKRHYGVAIEPTSCLSSPRTIASISAFRPDLILSVGFDLLFGPEILHLPTLGALNIHPGFLPRYAGLRAPLRALIDGEQRMGCTLHLIDRGIATGPIVAEDSVPITPDRSLHSYKVEIYLLGVQLFLDTVDATTRGRPLTGVAQPERQGCSTTNTALEQFRRLRELGIPAVNPADYCKLVQRFMPEGDVGLPALSTLWARAAA